MRGSRHEPARGVAAGSNNNDVRDYALEPEAHHPPLPHLRRERAHRHEALHDLRQPALGGQWPSNPTRLRAHRVSRRRPTLTPGNDRPAGPRP